MPVFVRSLLVEKLPDLSQSGVTGVALHDDDGLVQLVSQESCLDMCTFGRMSQTDGLTQTQVAQTVLGSCSHLLGREQVDVPNLPAVGEVITQSFQLLKLEETSGLDQQEAATFSIDLLNDLDEVLTC